MGEAWCGRLFDRAGAGAGIGAAAQLRQWPTGVRLRSGAGVSCRVPGLGRAVALS
jgi:hypothetical protein